MNFVVKNKKRLIIISSIIIGLLILFFIVRYNLSLVDKNVRVKYNEVYPILEMKNGKKAYIIFKQNNKCITNFDELEDADNTNTGDLVSITYSKNHDECTYKVENDEIAVFWDGYSYLEFTPKDKSHPRYNTRLTQTLSENTVMEGIKFRYNSKEKKLEATNGYWDELETDSIEHRFYGTQYIDTLTRYQFIAEISITCDTNELGTKINEFENYIPKYDENKSSVPKMSIDVKLDKKGNAKITEIWKGYFTDDTELYKPLFDLGYSKVSNFKVNMDGTDFTDIGNWNSEASFHDKAYKSGIIETNDGLELCFGMSDYGEHTYTFTYDISNFIFNVSDSQVLYWTFVNDNFNLNRNHTMIKISGPKKYIDDLFIYSHGNEVYKGVYDGSIYLFNDFSSGKVNMLVKYPLNTFNTTTNYVLFETFDDVYKFAHY